MRRFISGFLVLCFLQIGALGATSVPGVSAQSAILVEAGSGRVLYEKDADTQRLIASITKIMTALVAVERCPDVSQIVTITREDTLAEGSSMYLKVGEELTLEALLYGLLLSSGNDAALAIARHCAGDVDTFVGWMNERAVTLGMVNSSFANPNGLNADNHHSTARDMALLAIACMENELVSKIVGTTSINIANRTLTNHNKLLHMYDGCVGMKTGFTKLAGRTLISAARRDGQLLIGVTLNASNDWQDHSALFDYGFSNFQLETLVTQGQEMSTLPVTGSLMRQVSVQAKNTVLYPVSQGESVQVEMDMAQQAEAPLVRGETAGMLRFYSEGICIGETELIYAQSVQSNTVESQSLADRLRALLF